MRFFKVIFHTGRTCFSTQVFIGVIEKMKTGSMANLLVIPSALLSFIKPSHNCIHSNMFFVCCIKLTLFHFEEEIISKVQVVMWWLITPEILCSTRVK